MKNLTSLAGNCSVLSADLMPIAACLLPWPTKVYILGQDCIIWIRGSVNPLLHTNGQVSIMQPVYWKFYRLGFSPCPCFTQVSLFSTVLFWLPTCFSCSLFDTDFTPLLSSGSSLVCWHSFSFLFTSCC